MEKVVNQLILQSQNLARRVNSVEIIIEGYHEYKEDTEDFSKFLRDKVKSLDKNRANDNLSNKW